MKQPAKLATDSHALVKPIIDAFSLIWAELDGYSSRRLVLALAFVVGGSLASAAVPIAFKLVVDAYTPQATNLLVWTPLWLVAAYVADQLLFKCCGVLRQLAHVLGSQRLNRRVCRRVVTRVFSLPMRFHASKSTGALTETLSQGLNGYDTILQHALYTFLPVGVEFIAIVWILVRLDHTLYLGILLLTAIAYAIAFGRGASSITAPSAAISAAQIRANEVFTDSLLNYETVKYFNAESTVLRRYDAALAGIEKSWRTYILRITMNGFVLAAIFIASLGVSLVLAVHEVSLGTMTIGDVVLINGYVLRLIQPLEQVGYAVRDMAQGVSFLERMLALDREQTETGAAGNKLSADRVCGQLEFRNAGLVYGNSGWALQNVTFTVPAGKTVAIVGPNGSGKSSLVKLIFRLYNVSEGDILLDGMSTSSIAIADLRELIAVVPQDVPLFNDSIGYNIALGKRGATREEIERAAKVARIHDWIENMPDQYNTPVGERGMKISGGQKQRIAIARAIIKQPRIFVFDEATSSLDTKVEREILHDFMQISRDCTTLMIAHRLLTIVHADKIITLDGGRVVEQGTHAELLARNGVYTALWIAQGGEPPGKSGHRAAVV